jgi:hypothetical protein
MIGHHYTLTIRKERKEKKKKKNLSEPNNDFAVHTRHTTVGKMLVCFQSHHGRRSFTARLRCTHRREGMGGIYHSCVTCANNFFYNFYIYKITKIPFMQHQFN